MKIRAHTCSSQVQQLAGSPGAAQRELELYLPPEVEIPELPPEPAPPGYLEDDFRPGIAAAFTGTALGFAAGYLNGASGALAGVGLAAICTVPLAAMLNTIDKEPWEVCPRPWLIPASAAALAPLAGFVGHRYSTILGGCGLAVVGLIGGLCAPYLADIALYENNGDWDRWCQEMDEYRKAQQVRQRALERQEQRRLTTARLTETTDVEVEFDDQGIWVGDVSLDNNL